MKNKKIEGKKYTVEKDEMGNWNVLENGVVIDQKATKELAKGCQKFYMRISANRYITR